MRRLWGAVRFNLPLSFGESGQLVLGRFPGLGFDLLAAPSRPSTMLRAVACYCGFRGHHSGGTTPELHRFPYSPVKGTQDTNWALVTLDL